MAYAPMQQEEAQATLAVSWRAGLPRAVDIDKVIPAIQKSVSGNPKPLTVKIGDFKEAKRVGDILNGRSPGQYITAVMKTGDLRVTNAGAIVSEMEDHIRNFHHDTRSIDTYQGAVGVSERLEKSGFMVSLSKEGIVRALDVNGLAKSITGTMGRYATRTTNDETNSKQEAQAVAKAVNTQSNGKLFASADGTKVSVLNVESIATQIYRSRNLGTGTINDAVYTKQEAAAVTKYFNDQYIGQYTASVKENGAFEVNRVGLSKT